MNPYAVRLFWNEPDGSPNMMITSVKAETIADAISMAIKQLHTLHFIVDPCRIEATVDGLASKSGWPWSTAGSASQA